MSRRKCLNNANHFCYICGEYVFSDDRLSITALIQHRFYCYFKFKLGDQDKPFAPHTVCRKCSSNLSMWSVGKLKKLPFSTPMAWREQSNHVNDCYFCLTNVKGFTKKSAKHIVYPDLPSAVRPVPYKEGENPPKPTDTSACEENEYSSNNNGDDTSSEEYIDEHTHETTGLSQAQLDLFIKKLELSKSDACLAASMLKEFGVLNKETRISVYKHRDMEYQVYFKKDEDSSLVYCCDVNGLLGKLSFVSDAKKDWWLFIDGSVCSIKAVLLHIENKYPAVPMAYGRLVKETYETVNTILTLIQYSQYLWNVGGDLKIVGILTGMQQGYTKFCCFLCLWDSRDRQNHYTTNQWPARQTRVPGTYSIKYNSLVDPNDVLLPPLHIKLGLFKQFVKALNTEGEPMKTLRRIFPRLSTAKIKEGVFVGPQLRKIMESEVFRMTLNQIELRAWNALLEVVRNFLGKHRSSNYKEVVSELLDAFAALKVTSNYCGCSILLFFYLLQVNMSLKIHFLKNHLEFFPDDLGKVSDEHGERFHQTIKAIENRYQGRSDSRMMADFCWLMNVDP
jgi:hypothetical protein